GVKEMIGIPEAGWGGPALGPMGFPVPPDPASGGPRGLVRNGDRIRLWVKRRRIELLLDDAELKKRARVASQPPQIPQRGYAKLFAEQILGADEGCDFGFLC